MDFHQISLFFSRNSIDVSCDIFQHTTGFVLIQRSFCRIQNLNTRNIKKVWGGSHSISKKFADCFFSLNFIDVSYDNWWYTIVFVLILWSFCRIQNLNIRNSTKVVPRCIWWYHIWAAFKKKIKNLKLLKLQWHTTHAPANHIAQIQCKSKTSQRKYSVGQLKRFKH
jgi:hypothetical protein